MKPSVRFLAVAVLGWVGVRAAALGVLPGGDLFRIDRVEARPPPIAQTQFPEIEPLEPQATPPMDVASGPKQVGQYYQPMRVGVPVYRAAVSTPALDRLLPTPATVHFLAPGSALDEWPLSRISGSVPAPRQSVIVAPAQSIPLPAGAQRIDRIQVSGWALLRQQQTGVAGTPSLASGGTLGASQTGGRITYNFTRQIAATLRTSSEVGRRGAEVAAGVRIQPARAIPVWVTAERRQRLGNGGSGRNAFAIFFEGGVYQRPMPWRFAMDAYLQGGVVGHEGFLDGGMTLTRPIFRRVSAGVGVWGGMQPGLARLDAGPRVSVKVRDNMRVHLDWRQHLAGNAKPGSGAALTLAGDF